MSGASERSLLLAKKNYIKIERFYDAEKGQLMGSYIQPMTEAAVILDEVNEADIGDHWHLTIIEMEESEYEKLPEFTGY
jgi:hypothetical protein